MFPCGIFFVTAGNCLVELMQPAPDDIHFVTAGKIPLSRTGLNYKTEMV